MWQWLFLSKRTLWEALEVPWGWWGMRDLRKEHKLIFGLHIVFFFFWGGMCVWKIFSIDSSVTILSAPKYRLTVYAIDITKFYRHCWSETIFQNSCIIWSWSVNIHAIGPISTYSLYKNFFLLWSSVAHVGLHGSTNLFFPFSVWTCLSVSLSVKKKASKRRQICCRNSFHSLHTSVIEEEEADVHREMWHLPW